ncbi:MAG TPA: LacI family DNA-binding transcriptional regulator [Candidatus Methylacidiphilales bacterium]|jgi:LacI family transcriptional regulator|nr:LacI family DNA-binding transcriptional regulator [Candidatus Methylacidiphilales bacterium]
MAQTPTIRTIAKLAGVSNATVSLALRGHPRITSKVRERIRRIAAEVGYRSDPVVANLFAQLRSKKQTPYQSTLGFLYIGVGAQPVTDIPTFREWIGACEMRAESLGYSVDHFTWTGPELSPARLIQILDTRSIRGLAVTIYSEPAMLPPELAPVWQRSAVVIIGRKPVSPALSFVANDQYSTAIQAIDTVVKLGHQRPGLCINQELDESLQWRFAGGFCAGQLKLPTKRRLPICPFDRLDVDPLAEKKFKAWIKRHRPDVILTLHLEIKDWIENMGLRIPNDVGLVHLDKSPGLDWAGMNQNNELVGRAAVDLIVGQLHRNEWGVPPFQKSMLIGSTWSPGKTLSLGRA